MKNIRTNNKVQLLTIVLLLFVILISACARQTEVVERRTVDSPGATTTTIVERETVETEEGSTTVLGSIFDVVGEVLALPFRIVAGVFRFIF